METPSISRRRFAGWLGAGVAAAVFRPPSTALAALTPPAPVAPAAALDAVRLSSNENPYGPSPRALAAIRDSTAGAWRYPDEAIEELGEALARLHGVEPRQILGGAGSSEILRLGAAAFTGPDRPLVQADPTFESLLKAAKASGAEAVKVPLAADFRHDLPRMLAAATPAGGKPAGLIYVCNPNNPTASLTPKADLRAFLAKVPAQTAVLVDEAYHHYVESDDYESVIPLIRDHPNLIVARTFSKIYGLAGLRCGYAVAQPAAIERLAAHQAFDSLSLPAVAAARASLDDADHVPRYRAKNAVVRRATLEALAGMGLRAIPSAANFFMIELGRDVRPVIAGLKQRGVEVGRLFPALPNHLRVTVGTEAQMQSFLAALPAVLA